MMSASATAIGSVRATDRPHAPARVGRTPMSVIDPTDPEYGRFPLGTYLGVTVDDERPGEAEASIEVGERHLNSNGVVHVGVVFTLVDTAMGRATLSVLDEGSYCASIEVSVRFLRAVSEGRMTARVTVLQAGRRVLQLEGRVTVDGDDRPIASASGSFAVLGT
ncbi:MAG: PaaI family thioesterase [Actinobacteria bacterium]|nr:MAG: PaaI family thioesterase [Actinomycetota bacterium]